MDGAQLAARGRPLPLLNGSTLTLRYDFSALLAIEERFGGIGIMQERMSDRGLRGPVLTTTLELLVCGLRHTPGPNGVPWTVERLAPLLDPARIGEYSEAAGAALAEAFPTTAPTPTTTTADGNGASPGTTGTTSAPSSSDAAMSSSGG